MIDNDLGLLLRLHGLTEKELRNFSRKLESRGECLIWTAALNFAGSGEFGYRGKSHKAHRIVYAATHPNVDITKLFIAQSCGDSRCCEPRHLYSQTKKPMRSHPDEYLGKLHESTVARLRRMPWEETNKCEVARALGVSPSTVRKAMQGLTWKQHTSPGTSSAGLSKSTTREATSPTTTSPPGGTSGVHPWRGQTSPISGSTFPTAAQMKRR